MGNFPGLEKIPSRLTWSPSNRDQPRLLQLCTVLFVGEPTPHPKHPPGRSDGAGEGGGGREGGRGGGRVTSKAPPACSRYAAAVWANSTDGTLRTPRYVSYLNTKHKQTVWPTKVERTKKKGGLTNCKLTRLSSQKVSTLPARCGSFLASLFPVGLT